MAVVLVAGEDVRGSRRSRCPTVTRTELERLVDAWATHERHDARVIWESTETADDVIAREAARLREEGHEVWVATSDRDLRRRAAADRVIGGRTFLEELGA